MSTATRAVHDALFRLDDDGAIKLLGGFSPSSGKHHFPLLPACPYTGADDVQPVDLSDHGTLWGWTAVTTAPPGYEGDVPFGFGVVELPEGLRVITRITESDPARLEFGMPMHLVVAPLNTDADGTQVVTYAFEPDTSI
ncbi:MAG: OB-fold domain-containing protein [Acidimicrobiia bacterium]